MNGATSASIVSFEAKSPTILVPESLVSFAFPKGPKENTEKQMFLVFLLSIVSYTDE